VKLFHRPGPRFAAEAIAIVLAAAIPGLEHLVWWQIGLCVAIVLVAAIAVESRLGGKPAAPPAPAAEPARVEEVPHVRVVEERPLAELVRPPAPPPPPAPVVIAEPEPEPEPESEPEPVAVAVAAPPVTVGGPPFNVWELERALAASGAADDEKTFLLHYLRDYAGSDGKLPPEFDDLVRESFSSLL
jgi:hypothetical protein